MKDVKFKAWEKNLKEIIPVHNIDFESKIINKGSAWRTFDEIELLQYVGFEDLNGVEAYEDDVVGVKSELLANFGKTRTGKYNIAKYRIIKVDDSWGYEVLDNGGHGLVNGFIGKGIGTTLKFGVALGSYRELY